MIKRNACLYLPRVDKLLLMLNAHVFSSVQDAWLPQHVSRDDGLRPTLWPSHEQHAWNDEHTRWITLSNGAKHSQ